MSENAFSSVRGNCGDSHPSATQAKTELKAISLSEALDPPRGSSYAAAGGWSAVTLLDLPTVRLKATATAQEKPSDGVTEWDYVAADTDARTYEDYGVYHMSGWALAKVSIILFFS